MSVNQHKAPPGAKPYVFVTIGGSDYSIPLAAVAEVSRPSFGAGEVPSSVVLRGREMRLINLSAIFESSEPVHRIVRLHTNDNVEMAVAVDAVPGARWRLENTLLPLPGGLPAQTDEIAGRALGLLRLVGPEHAEQLAGHSVQTSGLAAESSL